MAQPAVTQRQALNIVSYLDHPALKPHVRRVTAGQYLFRQGDRGNTMFIIVDGTVWLVAERDEEEHVAGVLERGHFLGEKAALGTGAHTRFFSALAKTSATVIELGLPDLDRIQNTSPDLMIDILRRIFSVAADRIDRANHLIRLLRSSDTAKRLVELIIYFSESQGRKVPEGVEFPLNDDSIHYHVDMPTEEIDACLEELVAKKILKRTVNNYFVLRDPKALRDHLPAVRMFLDRTRARSQSRPSSFWRFGR